MCQPSSPSVKLPRLQYYQSKRETAKDLLCHRLRDSSAAEDITVCSSLGLEECSRTVASSPSHSVGALPYTPCSLQASWIDTALGISLSALSLSWPVALFWWCVPLPLPPCSWVKCCFYWLQWGSWYWETRNPITTLFLTAMPGTRGGLLGSEGGATGCDPGVWFWLHCLSGPWALISSSLTLTALPIKKAPSSIISCTSGASSFIH